MSFEPPQKGNPNQFVIRQHIHTAHAIAKFYGDDHRVDVWDLKSASLKRCQKRDAIFCARRVWDQRAEKGYMVRIENDFHEEIDTVKSFKNRNHEAISRYLLLWKLRHYYHLNRPNNSSLNGVSGSNLTKEQQENLEAKGASYVNPAGEIPSRFDVSLGIQVVLDRDWDTCSHFRWGLFSAREGEFIVADGYGGWPFIPISPQLAFIAGYEDCVIEKYQVEEINKHSIGCAKEFYFARKMAACPGA